MKSADARLSKSSPSQSNQSLTRCLQKLVTQLQVLSLVRNQVAAQRTQRQPEVDRLRKEYLSVQKARTQADSVFDASILVELAEAARARHGGQRPVAAATNSPSACEAILRRLDRLRSDLGYESNGWCASPDSLRQAGRVLPTASAEVTKLKPEADLEINTVQGLQSHGLSLVRKSPEQEETGSEEPNAATDEVAANAHGTRSKKSKKASSKNRRIKNEGVYSKVIAALVSHHGLSDRRVGDFTPLGVRALANTLEVSTGRVSNFFGEIFASGHAGYKLVCHAALASDEGREVLQAHLRRLQKPISTMREVFVSDIDRVSDAAQFKGGRRNPGRQKLLEE